MGCFNAGGSVDAGGTPTLVHPPLTVAALVSWLASARVVLLLIQTGAMLRTLVPNTIVNVLFTVGASVSGRTTTAGEVRKEIAIQQTSH